MRLGRLLVISTREIPADILQELDRSKWEYSLHQLSDDYDWSGVTIRTYARFTIWISDQLDEWIMTHLETLREHDPSIKPIIIVPDVDHITELEAYKRGCETVIHDDQIVDLLPGTLETMLVLANKILQRRYTLAKNALHEGIVIGTARLLHDINSPLTPIHSYLDILEIHSQLQGRKIEKPDTMLRSSVEKLQWIANQWRSFLVETEIESDTIDLLDPLRTVIGGIKSDYPQISLKMKPAAILAVNGDSCDSCIVRGADLHFEQIFHHVMQNAVEAVSQRPDPTIQVSFTMDTDSCYIIVDDNGPGVPADIEETFWKDFVTTKSTPGAGLGLGIVRYLLTISSGSIHLEKSPLGGARFRLQFRKRKNNSKM